MEKLQANVQQQGEVVIDVKDLKISFILIMVVSVQSAVFHFNFVKVKFFVLLENRVQVNR